MPFDQLGETMEARLRAGTVRYYDRGDGEPVVFVHGFMSNANLWRKVVTPLAETHRCIALDLPLGSHRSPMRPDADLSPAGLVRLVIDFMDKLRLETVTLVGSDIGGALCQMIVARCPERVSRLILLPSGHFSPLVFHYLEGATRTPRPRTRLGVPPAFGWAAKRPIDNEVAESYVRPAMTSHGVRRDMTKVLQGIATRYDADAMQEARRFGRPVLIAWPPEDRLFPFDRAVALSRAYPNARLEPIDDSFTYVPEDQPARLASLMLEFLQETEAAAPPQAVGA